jgi:hypothetical protein
MIKQKDDFVDYDNLVNSAIAMPINPITYAA